MNNKLSSLFRVFHRPAAAQEAATSHRFLHGISWGVLGGAVSKALLLLANVLLARFLGKTAYGEYGIIQNTIGMFGIFAGLGLGLMATKYVAQYKYTDPEKAGRVLGLSSMVAVGSGLLMALLLFILAPYLAAATLAAPHLTQSLRVGTLLLFLGAVTGAQTGALYGFEAFRKISIINVVVAVLCIPVTLLGVWRWHLTGALWAGVIVLLAQWGINHWVMRSECRNHGLSPNMAGVWAELPILWHFALPATLANIMIAPVTWAVSALLVNQPNGYAEMGIFNAANQWRTVLIFIPTLIGQIITPIMSERLGVGSNATARSMLRTSIIVSAIAVIPAALLLGAVSPWIMGQYGAAFTSGWPVLLVVLATVSLVALQTPIGNVIAASGRMWVGTAMNAGWGLVVIISALLLKSYGAFGLAAAFFIGYVVHSIWTFWFAWRTVSQSR
jgi:O-antigen/teichoic acid export membrane protein